MERVRAERSLVSSSSSLSSLKGQVSCKGICFFYSWFILHSSPTRKQREGQGEWRLIAI